MEQPKCFKCGSDRFVIKHHISYNPEKIVDCCRKCHAIIHHNVRKNNICPISPEEVSRISKISSIRRCQTNIKFGEPVGINAYIYEQITYNQHNRNVYISSWFESPSNIQLIQEEI